MYFDHLERCPAEKVGHNKCQIDHKIYALLLTSSSADWLEGGTVDEQGRGGGRAKKLDATQVKLVMKITNLYQFTGSRTGRWTAEKVGRKSGQIGHEIYKLIHTNLRGEDGTLDGRKHRSYLS